MLKIEDIEVGGILLEGDGRAAYRIIEINLSRVLDRRVWVKKNYYELKIGENFTTSLTTYERSNLNGTGNVYYPHGKWHDPDDAFSKHRERLINA